MKGVGLQCAQCLGIGMENFFVAEEMLPSGFAYPLEYINLVELGLVDFSAWNFITASRASDLLKHFRGRYRQTYVPFAEQRGSDDIACWVPGSAQVFVIEYLAVDGEEVMRTDDTFLAWLASAAYEMVEHFEAEVRFR